MPIFNRLERVFGKFKTKEEVREVLKVRGGDEVRRVLEAHYRNNWAQNVEDFQQLSSFEAYNKLL